MSDTVQLVFMVTLIVCWVTQTIVNFFQAKKLTAYKNALTQAYGKTDYVLQYCLRHVMIEAEQREDYETALKCKQLIEGLNKQIDKNP